MRYGATFENVSYATAPASWLILGIGVWVWRGKARILFQNAGFDKDVFRLLLRTKGGNSRTKLLKALLSPKDRMQLSKEVGIDWKAVDRHLKVLQEFGLIYEQVNSKTNARLFAITKVGELLLNILDKIEELEKEYYGQNNRPTKTAVMQFQNS
jgi:DNA-binding HxlR family transcriptional regulator